MGSCQKVPKFDFQSQFFMSNIIRIFLNFFFHTSLGADVLLLTFFDKINFYITLGGIQQLRGPILTQF